MRDVSGRIRVAALAKYAAAHAHHGAAGAHGGVEVIGHALRERIELLQPRNLNSILQTIRT